MVQFSDGRVRAYSKLQALDQSRTWSLHRHDIKGRLAETRVAEAGSRDAWSFSSVLEFFFSGSVFFSLLFLDFFVVLLFSWP